MKINRMLRRGGLNGLAILALSAVPGTAGAQGYQEYEQRNRPDLNRDRQEIRWDRVNYRSDWIEARRLARLIARLDGAQARRDVYQERRLRGQIREMLRQEIVEARLDLARDRREIWLSSQEARGGALDERRDLRDDRDDAIARERRLNQLTRINRRLGVIEPAVRVHNGWAMREEDRLLDSFQRLVRHDAEMTGRELSEDQEELREDGGRWRGSY